MTIRNKLFVINFIVCLLIIVFYIPSWGIIFKQIPVLHWRAITNAAVFWWVLIKGLFVTIFSVISWW